MSYEEEIAEAKQYLKDIPDPTDAGVIDLRIGHLHLVKMVAQVETIRREAVLETLEGLKGNLGLTPVAQMVADDHLEVQIDVFKRTGKLVDRPVNREEKISSLNDLP